MNILLAKKIVDTVKVSDLDNTVFFIPKYQRGYRWDSSQVRDLLDDIDGFDDADGKFYCLQPLVVKRHDDGFEVIDGQQRLTTIYILQRMLDQGKIPFDLSYETRDDSRQYLRSDRFCGQKIDDTNVDFYHISNARIEIGSWMQGKGESDLSRFLNKLRNSTRFIWYAPEDEDPVTTFTRLNVDKIPLTNAELIRSLILKDTTTGEERNVRAMEWDRVETALKNDEFWLFFHPVAYTSETRIDFLFELIVSMERLGVAEIGALEDRYKAFRYIARYLEKSDTRENAARRVWDEILLIFNALKNWFDDIELYHYVGYIVAKERNDKESIEVARKAIVKWLDPGCTKGSFISDYLKAEISASLVDCNDLSKNYFVDRDMKRQCVPLLLLFNVQTIVQQSKRLRANSAYAMPISHRFPFHLYKLENWDVEHIASATDNESRNKNDQIEWVKQHLASLDKIPLKLKEKAYRFCIDYEAHKTDFENLVLELSALFKPMRTLKGEARKNMIGNFALLDRGTNRSYHNDHFPVKRRKIAAKECGQIVTVELLKDDHGEIGITSHNKSAAADTIPFVPMCTKNVFLKFYTPLVDSLNEWDDVDFDFYTKAIFETLRDFGVVEHK